MFIPSTSLILRPCNLDWSMLLAWLFLQTACSRTSTFWITWINFPKTKQNKNSFHKHKYIKFQTYTHMSINIYPTGSFFGESWQMYMSGTWFRLAFNHLSFLQSEYLFNFLKSWYLCDFAEVSEKVNDLAKIQNLSP